jgi:hypothetical protein
MCVRSTSYALDIIMMPPLFLSRQQLYVNTNSYYVCPYNARYHTMWVHIARYHIQYYDISMYLFLANYTCRLIKQLIKQLTRCNSKHHFPSRKIKAQRYFLEFLSSLSSCQPRLVDTIIAGTPRSLPTSKPVVCRSMM